MQILLKPSMNSFMWSWNEEVALFLSKLLAQYNKPRDSIFLSIPSSSLAGTLLWRLEQAGDIRLGKEQADLKKQKLSVATAVCKNVLLAELSRSSLYMNFIDIEKSFC